MTQLEMVNRILRRLREDTVSSVMENDYAMLIASFVNDAKADMEDINHTWSAYETEITINVLADGTRNYDIPGINDRSFLLRSRCSDKVPLAHDVTTNEAGQLYDIALKQVRETRNLTNNIVDVVVPRYFALQADNDVGDGYQIQLLYGSTTARTWRMYWYVPQDDLALDGSDDNTQLILPNRPIFLTALFYALNERGEELGIDNGIAYQRSKNSIAAALETDMQVQKKSDELDLTNKERNLHSVPILY